MRLVCPECGAELDIACELPDGQHVRCSVCGQKFVYSSGQKTKKVKRCKRQTESACLKNAWMVFNNVVCVLIEIISWFVGAGAIGMMLFGFKDVMTRAESIEKIWRLGGSTIANLQAANCELTYLCLEALSSLAFMFGGYLVMKLAVVMNRSSRKERM